MFNKHIIHAQFPLCYKGGEAQASKKQCVANKKAKAKPTCTTSKDPQSAAAKVCSSNLIINLSQISKYLFIPIFKYFVLKLLHFNI